MSSLMPVQRQRAVPSDAVVNAALWTLLSGGTHLYRVDSAIKDHHRGSERAVHGRVLIGRQGRSVIASSGGSGSGQGKGKGQTQGTVDDAAVLVTRY